MIYEEKSVQILLGSKPPEISKEMRVRLGTTDSDPLLTLLQGGSNLE